MNIAFKNKINNLAALFYKLRGYKLMTGYDFSKANHPDEKLCWNQAIIAHAFFNNDNDALKYQI